MGQHPCISLTDLDIRPVVASVKAGVADAFLRRFVISRLFAIRFMLPWNKGKPFFGENIGGVYVLQSTDISISEADIRGH